MTDDNEGESMTDVTDLFPEGQVVRSADVPEQPEMTSTRQGEPPWEDGPSTDPSEHVVLEGVLRNMAQAVREERTQNQTPQVVTLCGSTRFRHHFEAAERVFTRAGIIVLTVGGFWSREEGSLEAAIGAEDAARVYGLHMDKISMSDAVVLLDVAGYEGETTRMERLFAEQIGVPVLSYNTWTTRAPLSQAPLVAPCEHVWVKDVVGEQYRCERSKGCTAAVTYEEIQQAQAETLLREDLRPVLTRIWAAKQ